MPQKTAVQQNPVLIIGENGQLAQSLMTACTARHIPYLAAGRPTFDMAQPDTLEAIFSALQTKHDFTALINTSAYTAVDKAEEEEDQAETINAVSPALLARLAFKAGIPFFHISTDYVFDGTKPDPYTEDDLVCPINAYGRTKRNGEKAVLAANPSAYIFRTSWVYSPYGQNFLKTMLRLAETRTELKIVGDQIGCPTYAPHMADSLLDCLARLTGQENTGTASPPPAGIYHMAGAGACSWYEFAAFIFQQCAELASTRSATSSAIKQFPHPTLTAIPARDYPTPAARPANSKLSCLKLSTEFGIRLPHWHVGVKECLQKILQDC